jgi:hypothetical protein
MKHNFSGVIFPSRLVGIPGDASLDSWHVAGRDIHGLASGRLRDPEISCGASGIVHPDNRQSRLTGVTYLRLSDRCFQLVINGDLLAYPGRRVTGRPSAV